MRVGDLMTRSVLSVREWEELGLSKDLMRFQRFRHLPVVDADDRLVGILSRTDLLQLRGRDRRETRSLPAYQVAQREVVTIEADAAIEEAAELMRKHRIHSLPVVDRDGRLAGILTDSDILSAVTGQSLPVEQVSLVEVGRVMTPNPATIDADATVGDAAGTMLEGGFRHLPVIDADGALVGMLSERDLRTALGIDFVDWSSLDPPRLDQLVSNIMMTEPVIVRASNRLVDVIHVFTDERIGAVPVLDDEDRLVGILSYVDVIAWLQKQVERSGYQSIASAEQLH